VRNAQRNRQARDGLDTSNRERVAACKLKLGLLIVDIGRLVVEIPDHQSIEIVDGVDRDRVAVVQARDDDADNVAVSVVNRSLGERCVARHRDIRQRDRERVTVIRVVFVIIGVEDLYEHHRLAVGISRNLGNGERG
jgi:hypothetical protein